MSSPEENNDSETALVDGGKPEKKRRVRACDMCRRRKVRCDGGRMPGNQCSNCVTFKYNCTYAQASKKRFADPEYVQNLEAQLSQTQELLQKLSVRLNAAENPKSPGTDKGSWLPECSNATSPSSSTEVPTKSQLPPFEFHALMPQDTDGVDLSDDEWTAKRSLEQSLRHLSLDKGIHQFLGKSSNLLFLQTALDMKEEFVGGKLTPPAGVKAPPLGTRPEFWIEHPWLAQTMEREYPFQAFPEPPLMTRLIDLYFTHCNPYMPILHRNIFEQGVREGLHLIDSGFGATVLLVCAIGARFSDDPLILLQGSTNPHSAGWKWFHEVQSVRKAIRLSPPRLYDLQIAMLVAMFLHGSSVPQASFGVIGDGIRLAQDIGAHRRKMYNTVSRVEGELLKRAFWVLVCMDRALSSGLGRSCCIQDEDFDLDGPIECDDEYWFHPDPALAFKQPAGKPSKIAFFTCLIRLNQIHACALRTIYAINKSKAILGTFVGPQWEQHIVTELDSALNKWIDSVPEHLRWDPNMENTMFLNQSALLYSTYYTLQITIHRPYIPSPRKPSPFTYPSLAICTNAARSCVHVLDVQYHRSAASTYQNMMALFSSGIVLLLNIWSGKRAGSSADLHKEMGDVHKVMIMLKALEPRWHTAGRVLDILCELATIGDLPLPQGSNLKRGRDSDGPEISTPTVLGNGPRFMAGTKRVQHHQASSSGSISQISSPSSMVSSLPQSFNPPHSSDPSPPLLSSTRPWPTYETSPAIAGPSQVGSLSHMNNTSSRDASTDTPFGLGFILPSVAHDTMVSSNAESTGPATPQFPPAAHSGINSPSTTPADNYWTGMSTGTYATSPFPDVVDSDTLAMWSSAPACLEWDDWSTYISNMSGIIGDNSRQTGPNI